MSEDDSSNDWFESSLEDDVESDSDDDWFEESLEDDGQDENGGTTTDESEEGEPFGDVGDQSSDGQEGGASFDDETDESSFGSGTDDEGDDGGLFDDDFSAEMESVDAGFDDDGGSGGGTDFGGGGGADFGGGGGADFGGGGGADFGGGGGADFGGDDEELSDEELESDIPRLKLGVEGLDNMIQGGIPKRHLMVAIGGPGTGKTTLGLQFLQYGLAEADDNCVFITLEQTYDDIMSTADERGWDFERYENEDRLAVIDLDPVEMANSLDNIRGELPRLIKDFGADRLVLDSVSLLEMMYDKQARRRTEIFDFTQSLKKAGVTTLFTSEADDDNAYVSRHGIIEYLTDAVFVLRYVRGNTDETWTAVEIQKIRNANHSRQTKPYELTETGIDVYEQAEMF